MEILAELLFTLLMWLAELALQLVLEILAEMGLRVLREPFRPTREVSPWVAALGYAVYGAAVGGLSLLVFPLAFLAHPWARAANLVLTPLAAGVVMSMMGAWRRRRGEQLVRLDRFSYGVLFALSLGVVRHVWADIG